MPGRLLDISLISFPHYGISTNFCHKTGLRDPTFSNLTIDPSELLRFRDLVFMVPYGAEVLCGNKPKMQTESVASLKETLAFCLFHPR